MPQGVMKPSEVVGIFREFLGSLKSINKVVFLRGIYIRSRGASYRGKRYDTLRDEDTTMEITLQIPETLASNLSDGNLVYVGGYIDKRIWDNGNIQLQLVVSRVEVAQQQVVDEAEQKRIELRQRKAAQGFKNIDGILEQKLYAGERPRIVLLLAQTSITMSDFEAGINAAKSAIDFVERRVNFSSPEVFASALRQLDTEGYDAIAVVRGGGSGLDSADDLKVLEALSGMTTPVIAAIGHVEDRLYFKQMSDKVAPTPTGLGQYFSEMVETVSERKTKSRAALTEQIKKQFQEQLAAGQKQNKELLEQIEKLTKGQQEESKRHNEQIEKANRQNQELQKRLMDISKANEEAQKAHNAQLSQLRTQLSEMSVKQQPGSTLWIVVAAVVIIIILAALLFLK